MAKSQIRLDRAGMEEMLKSAKVAAEIGALAADVGARAEGHVTRSGDTIPVVVEQYVTDRAAAAVLLRHPAGMAVEAKYGLLTRAAAAAGLEVRRRAAR